MDTKSKKSRFKLVYKVTAWALCIACACAGVIACKGIDGADIHALNPTYAQSDEAFNAAANVLTTLQTAYIVPDESEIAAAVDAYVRDIDDQMQNELSSINLMYASEYDFWPDETEAGFTPDDTLSAVDTPDTADEGGAQENAVQAYRRQRTEEIQEKYAALIQNARETVVRRLEEERAFQMEQLTRNTDFIYAVQSDGELVLTNVEGDDPLAYVRSQQVGMESEFTGSEIGMESYYGQPGIQQVSGETGGHTLLAVALRPEAFARNEQDYSTRYETYKMWLTILALCIALFIGGLAWLVYATGKTPDHPAPRLHKSDRIVYLDVGFFIMAVVETALVTLSLSLFFGGWRYPQSLPGGPETVVLGVCMAGVVSVPLIWLLSFVRWNRHGGAGRFTLAYAIFGGIREMRRYAGVTARAAGAVALYAAAGLLCSLLFLAGVFSGGWMVLLAGTLLLVAYIAFSTKYFLKKAADIRAVEEGVNAIKAGDTSHKIAVRADGGLCDIADGINNIAAGLSAAVQKEVKAERMKTELITNISHDLKTPLTSILTYVDLLKKEPGLGGEARKYLDVLDAKSTRLKVLTDDLFEAAKASSGDMAVQLSRIELTQFLEQAFAEWADRINASGIAFETPAPREKLYVIADGRMLFRVLGNAIDNALQYSLPGSRVYVDISPGEGLACIVIKNVSREKLNITEEELMERFMRGDSSRNTEGSGLGLSIAQNLTRLMNGLFSIDIDGDLFKARICLPCAENGAPEKC